MNVVEVWRVDLGPGAPAPAQVAAALDEADRRRCASVSGRRRVEFALCRAAVRTLLASRTGRKPSDVRWDTGPSGKPGPATGDAEVHWNLTHAAERALVALSATGPVGVDLVREDDLRMPVVLADRFLTDAEGDLVRRARPRSRRRVCARLLARKEALVKAEGIRLFDGLGLEAAAPGPVTGPSGRRWRIRDLPMAPGWSGALATEYGTPTPVAARTWTWRGWEAGAA